MSGKRARERRRRNSSRDLLVRESSPEDHTYSSIVDDLCHMVSEYIRARDIARHIAAKRPGTSGDERPTGCLRTLEEWQTWQRRYDSRAGRRIRTAESALLTELVAAHKQRLVTVPMLASRAPVDQKIAWLSSLGHGSFTRAQ